MGNRTARKVRAVSPFAGAVPIGEEDGPKRPSPLHASIVTDNHRHRALRRPARARSPGTAGRRPRAVGGGRERGLRAALADAAGSAPRCADRRRRRMRDLAQVRELSVRHPDTHLVLFADDVASAERDQLLAFGVSACLSWNTQARDVRSTIHLASRGMHLAPLASRGPAGAPEREPLLTRREADVLSLLRKGHGNGQIAIELHIGVETVRTHARHIYRKLGVASRRALLALPSPGRLGRASASRADGQQGAAGHAAREPGDGAWRETDATVGGGRAQGARRGSWSRESRSGPGPPSNSCRTAERALVARANGPPCAPLERESASSMKKWPRGVGGAAGPDDGPEAARDAAAVGHGDPARGESEPDAPPGR